MFNFLQSRRKKRSMDILDIETILQSGLKPITPRPEFIQNLHRSLMEYTFSEPESSGFDVKRTALMALIGMVSLIFVLSLWLRLIVVIISTLGMIQAGRQKKKPLGNSIS